MKFANRKIFVFISWIFCNILALNGQEIDKPRGPWQLAFKVVSGNWDSAATGYSSFWSLFSSTDTYNTASPVPDQRDFSTSSDHYKSELVQQWEDGYISVQAIKLSLFKNNEEKAYVVFDAVGRTKTTWFKCDNILYSSYTDLPDNTLPTECPGKNAMGLPLTMMKLSYFHAYCPDTTGWLVIADVDFSFSICPNYMPADDPKPYFKYSTLTTVADLSTELETADSIGIFFQVWGMTFKGVEGIKPSAAGLTNLTGLFMLDITENDNSDLTVRNLQHTQTSQIFKSDVINLWDTYFIDMVKFSMFKSGVEEAYVVFDGTNTDKLSWFSDLNILYSSYGSSLGQSSLEICSIEGDGYRHWQIQSLGDELGCSDSEQMGWMLVKEPRNNGTCSWDTSTIKKKPYFLYNTGTTAASPSTFQYADVIAVFVHGWRMVLKVEAGGSVAPKSSIFSLWSDIGGMNEDVEGAASLTSGTTFKSSIIDQWTSFYIRAVKIAAYKDGLEVFNAVFDATGSSSTDWFNCARLLYTTVTGLTSSTASTNSYTCSLESDSSTFRFFIGKSPNCGSVSATGMFSVVDVDSACSSKDDLPLFMYSNTIGTTLSDTTASQLADTFAIFVDMANCYSDTCLNGATCQDLGGNFRCFCTGDYFGETCANLNGTFGEWSTWSYCSVTCANGTQSRNRTCEGAEGVGTCAGESIDTKNCTLDPCPIDGGYTEWITWTTCTVTCGTGTRSRSRDCTNPVPQFGGSNCSEPSTESENCSTNPCPIDGGHTDWTEWSECTVTCETGNKTRQRSCTNPAPQHGGSNCVGDTIETRSCDTGPCPINGGYTEWNEWTTCTVTCGGGDQSRSRECTSPTPQYGGLSCTGNSSETQSCNSDNCPIDGGYTEWNEWTTCTVTCGGGDQSRSRECTNPTPQYGGLPCTGDSSETQSCNSDNCPIDGGYTEWNEWTTCTVTCGGGDRSRSRECTNPTPQYGGLPCTGDSSETQSCNSDYCPIDGGYTEWNEWTTCSVTCGGGDQSRSRECTNPSPQYGGLTCIGNSSETQNCNSDNCPIDGGYTEWNEWTTCTVTCGGGDQSRSRECSNPTTQYGGLPCPGNSSETQNCNSDNCPIDGGYTEWIEWTTCTVTCGGGDQSRSRECTNPTPQYGGLPCIGNSSETQNCNSDNCPIDGGYTEWNEWTTCTVTCGEGDQSRSRECTNPTPQYGGLECTGHSSETQSCNSDNCPIDGGYTEWNEWTTCTFTCGGGDQSRSRECTNPTPQYNGLPCTGNLSETQSCNSDNCPIDGGYTEWNDWTMCTVTCGGGGQSRSRECTSPSPQYGGLECTGHSSETQSCNTDNCPIDGGYTEWNEWTTCTVTCGGGDQSRSRECTNPSPQYSGLECTGHSSETQSCNTDNCPIDGGYTEWNEWTTCTVTCGGGDQSRSRECTNLTPQYGGLPCTEDSSETQSCNSDNCPIDGGYTEWNEWTTCTVTCGGGDQSRSRECTNPTPQYGGLRCTGDSSETQSCNSDNCPIDGGFTDWNEWATCTVTCGGGDQSRSRECTNPTTQYGGIPCTGNSFETQSCNSDNCPIDGGHIEWNEWTTCTVTCGGGDQSRSRECTNPTPQYGGLPCTLDSSETQSCNSDNCPIDGGYTEWNEWTTCTVTCGGGDQSRSRECTNPTPQYGGLPCTLDSSETQSCNSDNCPIDGGYTEWNEWTTCSITCGGGDQTRFRECTNPTPQYGGLPCTGNTTESQSCNSGNCPIDGGYTEWNEWTTCTVTCGGGDQSRSRECTNPSPQHGGLPCTGNSSETQSCNSDNCPIDGGYTEWNEWTTCTFTCGGGDQSRSRECTNPTPQYGGLPCTGNTTESQSCNSDNCPIDGGYTEWNEWTTCSATCGGGDQSRSRECTNPSPQYGGLECTGDLSETQNCNGDNCPIDGGYTEWNEWTTCTVTCGEGDQSRSRECTNPTPQYGGVPCTGNSSETQSCNSDNCPIDGGYTEWNEWTTCSATCGGGDQSRSRECTNPTPQYGGLQCLGEEYETLICGNVLCPDELGFSLWSYWTSCTKSCDSGIKARSRECLDPNLGCAGPSIDTDMCNTQPCPSINRQCENPVCLDGGFTLWSEWSQCSATCGVGEITRSRECTNPTPKHGGEDCDGAANDTLACSSDCPIDGQFTDWTAWTQCSATCGDGNQTRSRSCSNPAPQFGGDDCIGDTYELQTCNLTSCPQENVDGGFSDWSDWTECSVTCGGGQQTRGRTCSDPEPQNGGNDCVGDLEETQECNTESCPPDSIDGGFSEWSYWTQCSVTCNGGQQTRNRTCSNPEPQNGGKDCIGESEETQSCNTDNCPQEIVDGGFSDWSVWTECSVTCGVGSQTRNRSCSNPEPQNGGNDCVGDLEETQSCNADTCPQERVDGGFNDWSVWTECSVTCGGGNQARNRTCSNPEPQNGGNNCLGDLQDTQSCNADICPQEIVHGGFSYWSEWTECSVTCGGGNQVRNRTCSNPKPQNGGNDCVGDLQDTQSCNTDTCPHENIDGGFSDWSEWTECSVTCGGGYQARNRTCSNPEPQNGGNDCIGDIEETETCNTDSCPSESVDGSFSDWTEWTECSATCGGGNQIRNRTCSNPKPQNGGNDCIGDLAETKSCNIDTCPQESVDGGFSYWSEWTECEVTCGGGDQTRNRTCSNPEPQNGGNDCVGDLQETKSCNEDSCPPDALDRRRSASSESIDGGFSDWSEWAECSVTCGGGQQTRSRTCTNPEPQNGGIDCVGDLEESQSCNTDSCPPVDGGFTEWTTWTDCSVTCGEGQQTRSRTCTNPEPQFGGNDCVGIKEGVKVCNVANCPVYGGFTDWSTWSECSVTCGNGTHVRSRDCTNPEPQYGGEDCVGETEESEICELDPCPVDGYWLNWEDWTTCSEVCGSGTRERNRTCVQPSNGGNPCDGAGQQMEYCNTQECPLDGVWSEWATWTECNATCEGGVRERTRTCIGPLHGGVECIGISRETEVCNDIPCPIDGYWANWNEWYTCTVTCNTGTRERTRDCIDPQYGGKNCTGAAMQTTFCNTNLCPVDGEWLDWTEWSACTVSCDGGSRNRSRTCKEPLYGGLDCVGNETETETCNEQPCPVDGYWLEWSAWDLCSVSCSDGIRNRSRMCEEPLHGGTDCVGESSQSEYCNNGICPIDGFWLEWSEWTKCSKSCGGGYRNKSRDCNEPLYGGLMCQGEISETDTCNIDACPIDGEWLEWSEWSSCTKTCGGGTREKTRNCTEPKYGGKFCDGESSETDMCNIEPCAVDGYWEEWSNWTACSVTCAGGSRNRTRACVQPRFGGKECNGVDYEEEECNTQNCPVDGTWTTWINWSECSTTCNGGARNRSRSCIGTMFGGKYCEGHDIDIQICALEACPSVDGGWSDWTSWTACSMSCGWSERTRNRTCTNPSPQWGGQYCSGIHIKSESCKENDCPVDGEWSSWTEWSSCFNMTVNDVSSTKCGRGNRSRNRSCDNPAPQFAGTDCNGNSTEIKNCNILCHTITCSKEHPERCQIVFHNIPDNEGSMISSSIYVVIWILSTIMRLYN